MPKFQGECEVDLADRVCVRVLTLGLNLPLVPNLYRKKHCRALAQWPAQWILAHGKHCPLPPSWSLATQQVPTAMASSGERGVGIGFCVSSC